MPAKDFTGKTDAELMRFCSATSRTLGTLSRRIAAAAVPVPEMDAAFDDLSEQLTFALAELEGRYA